MQSDAVNSSPRAQVHDSGEPGDMPGTTSDPGADEGGVADPAVADEWVSAADWSGIDASPQPPAGTRAAGWYPPQPTIARPGPVPVERPRNDLSPRAAARQEPAASPARLDDEYFHLPPAPPAPKSGRFGTPAGFEPAPGDDPADSTYAAAGAPLPQRAPRPAGLLERLRDRIALQRALRSQGSELDDNIEIISGVGAPPRGRGAAADPQPRTAPMPSPHVSADAAAPRDERTRPEAFAHPEIAMPALIETDIDIAGVAQSRPGTVAPDDGEAATWEQMSWDDPATAAEAPPADPLTTDAGAFDVHSTPTPTPAVAPPPLPTATPMWDHDIDDDGNVDWRRDDWADTPRADAYADAAAVHGDLEDDELMPADSPSSPLTPVAGFPSDAMRGRLDDIEPLDALRAEAMRRHGLVEPEPAPRGDVARIGRLLAVQFITAARGWMERGSAVLRAAHIDTRAAVAGGAVLILLVIGLITGRHVTPIPTASTHHQSTAVVPHGSAAPSAAPVIVPSPVASSSAATPQPAPSAAPPSPSGSALALSNVQQVGAGASGDTVTGLRYGAHPGDFRIVFDLSGSSSPTTVIGFSNPTTMVVVFKGTSLGSALTPPASSAVITGVTTLRSSTPGQTIVQFTLAHPVTAAAGYLASPLRLVIDLT